MQADGLVALVQDCAAKGLRKKKKKSTAGSSASIKQAPTKQSSGRHAANASGMTPLQKLSNGTNSCSPTASCASRDWPRNNSTTEKASQSAAAVVHQLPGTGATTAVTQLIPADFKENVNWMSVSGNQGQVDSSSRQGFSKGVSPLGHGKSRAIHKADQRASSSKASHRNSRPASSPSDRSQPQSASVTSMGNYFQFKGAKGQAALLPKAKAASQGAGAATNRSNPLFTLSASSAGPSKGADSVSTATDGLTKAHLSADVTVDEPAANQCLGSATQQDSIP